MSELLHDASVWVAISFAIFAIGAFKVGRGRLIGMLDARIDAIRKEIESAESLRVESQELLAQYQRKQRDATKEAAEIIETAQKSAAEIKKKAEKDLDETIKRREQQLQERLERMEEAAIQEIRSTAASLAMAATTEIINNSLDKKTNDNLVDGSIKNIAKTLK